MRLCFLIVGCGIAGITAAIALAKVGHFATVLEVQETFSEVERLNAVIRSDVPTN